jgi:hypothetical protein
MFAHVALLAAITTASPTPTAGDIYRAALKRLTQLSQPPYIDMTAHWKVLAETPQGEQPGAFDERVLFDSTARRECVLFLPYSPDSRALIGRSYFAPDMWLIRRPVERTAQTEQPDFAPDLSDLRTIAAVVSVAKPSYEITFAGAVSITNGGGTSYHLILRPLRDPWKHNLRELWINAATFDIMRAVLVGDYRPDPQALLEQTTVAEDFGSVGPYWMVVHHTWTYRDAPSDTTFQYDVQAVSMKFPDVIPAWYFDAAQFDRHRSEVR